MSIQCVAMTKNGTQCKNASSADSTLCKRHADYAGHVFAGVALDVPQDEPETAPIIASSAPETAPINTEVTTMTTAPETAPETAPAAPAKNASSKDKARAHFEARQRAKRQQIASSAMTTSQKETARMLLARESDKNAPIIAMNVARDDESIMAFDLALRDGARHVLAIKPADYDKRPRWLDEKTWKKAKRAFNVLYARDGAGAFDRDQDGRLIMPLPMTPARYMGAVVSGDITSVLRFAGAWRESDDGTFTMIATMDGVAPIIASVYRAGAGLNRASSALDKAQEKLDASSADDRDSLTTKRDMARVARDVARDSFIRAYMDAVENAPALDASARATAGAILAQFATPETAPNTEVTTDLIA